MRNQLRRRFYCITDLPIELYPQIMLFNDNHKVVLNLILSCKEFYEFFMGGYPYKGCCNIEWRFNCKKLQPAIKQFINLGLIKHIVLTGNTYNIRDFNLLKHLDGVENLNMNYVNYDYICEVKINPDIIKHLQRVSKLNMSFSEVNRLHFPFFSSLRELSISLEESDVRTVYVKDFRYLKTLEVLKINGSQLTDKCLFYLKKLKQLYILSAPHVSDAGLLHLNKLEVLSVPGDEKINGSCFEKLTNLKHLRIERTGRITDKPMKICSRLDCLQVVFNCCDVNTVTVKCFNFFKNLKSIVLHCVKELKNKDMIFLNQIEDINMSTNDKITDDGIINLKMVKRLELSFFSKITHRGVKDLEYLKSIKINKCDLVKKKDFALLKTTKGLCICMYN